MNGREVLRHYRQGKRNFSRTRVKNAALHGVDLRKIDLSWANLHSADLSETDLSGANLRGSDLRQADLTDTNLEGVDLRGANLYEAMVSRSQLDQAKSIDHMILPDGTRYGQ